MSLDARTQASPTLSGADDLLRWFGEDPDGARIVS